MGLTHNFNKCEVIQSHEVDLPAPLDSFATSPPDDACLLEAPLPAGNALEVALEKCCSELSLGLSRLPELARHDAIILFRSSLSSSKLLHTLRCFPCMGPPLLNRFDHIMPQTLTNSLNVALADCNWDQVPISYLPIRDGGLGIRRVSTLAVA